MVSDGRGYITYDHPGAKPGEIFFGIMSEDYFRDRCGWATKRLGLGPAYGQNGQKVPGRPVFVQRSEAVAKFGEVTVEPMTCCPVQVPGTRRTKYEAVKV